MSTKSVSLDEQRERLERRANVIRSRLLRTIDALDDRRHQVQELGHHAKRLATPLAATVAGAAILALGTTFAIRALVRRRKSRTFAHRLSQALAPLRAEVKPPIWQDALRNVTLTVVGMLATELAKRGAVKLFDGETLPALGSKIGDLRARLLPPAPPVMLLASDVAPASVDITSQLDGNGASGAPVLGR